MKCKCKCDCGAEKSRTTHSTWCRDNCPAITNGGDCLSFWDDLPPVKAEDFELWVVTAPTRKHTPKDDFENDWDVDTEELDITEIQKHLKRMQDDSLG